MRLIGSAIFFGLLLKELQGEITIYCDSQVTSDVTVNSLFNGVVDIFHHKRSDSQSTPQVRWT